MNHSIPLSRRIDLQPRDAGARVVPPRHGRQHPSPRELARQLRVYGGPSLESRRDNANATAWLSGALACIAMIYGELLSGWGWLLSGEIMFAVAIIAGLIWADAIRRRNKNERRIAEAETAALRAVAAALAHDDAQLEQAA